MKSKQENSTFKCEGGWTVCGWAVTAGGWRLVGDSWWLTERWLP